VKGIVSLMVSILTTLSQRRGGGRRRGQASIF
jgi:hypothetical protein